VIVVKKAKIGRPATGHDPTVTIRVPQTLIDEVEWEVGYIRKSDIPAASEVTASTIWREAIHQGLWALRDGTAAPHKFLPYDVRLSHPAEIHEAGHVVVLILIAEEEGLNPQHFLDGARLKPRGAGVTYSRNGHLLTPEGKLLLWIAGCAAEALDQGRSFDQLWAEYPMGNQRGNDRKNAARLIREHGLDLEAAVDYVYRKFTQRDVWAGLVAVARAFYSKGKLGSYNCYDAYETGRDQMRREMKAGKKRKGKKKTINWVVKGED
jgi:hypothetical protein